MWHTLRAKQIMQISNKNKDIGTDLILKNNNFSGSYLKKIVLFVALQDTVN